MNTLTEGYDKTHGSKVNPGIMVTPTINSLKGLPDMTDGSLAGYLNAMCNKTKRLLSRFLKIFISNAFTVFHDN